MKGDRGRPFACPLACGLIMNPRSSKVTTKHHATPRSLTRRAAREHIAAYHPTVGGREMSLILDTLCERLGF